MPTMFEAILLEIERVILTILEKCNSPSKNSSYYRENREEYKEQVSKV
jgi:hypothetical protein